MDFLEHAEDYRSLLPNVTEDGKRKWLYPLKPSGKWHKRRVVVTSILLTIFFAMPLIQVNGSPFFLLNFLERKFILFGVIFWPQDTIYLLLAALIFFVFIILFTVAFGRIWCGWACPQTLFMEMVFRKIEYAIEGNASQQKLLNKRPWDWDKLWRKGLKHFIFIAISLAIGHTAMAYIVGMGEMKHLVWEGPAAHLSGFIALLAFSTVFYLVFSQLREIACTIICPYGRLQGALITPDTFHVIYDESRGEPRGKKEGSGDCINCFKCVASCPTGIDIRNGIQLDCVNCTACIDACDDIMRKVGKPEGLVRYGSQQSIKHGTKPKMDARKWGYTGVLSVLVGIFVVLLATRSAVEATITKIPGKLYTTTHEGHIQNLFKLQVINKTRDSIPIALNPDDSFVGLELAGGGTQWLAGSEKKDLIFMVTVPLENLKGHTTPLSLTLQTGVENQHVEIDFAGPMVFK